MKYPWIDEYLLSMAGVTKDLQADWNWIRYQIGGNIPCSVWRDTKDPSLSEQDFETTIKERIQNLKGGAPEYGI